MSEDFKIIEEGTGNNIYDAKREYMKKVQKFVRKIKKEREERKNKGLDKEQ